MHQTKPHAMHGCGLSKPHYPPFMCLVTHQCGATVFAIYTRSNECQHCPPRGPSAGLIPGELGDLSYLTNLNLNGNKFLRGEYLDFLFTNVRESDLQSSVTFIFSCFSDHRGRQSSFHGAHCDIVYPRVGQRQGPL